VVSALVKQVKQQQWAWFICTLLFGFFPIFGDIYMLIYLITVPETSQYIASADARGNQQIP